MRSLADVHAFEAVRGIIFGVFDVDDAVLVALLILNGRDLEVVIFAAQLGRSFFVAAPRAIDFEGELVLLNVVLKLDEHIIVTESGAFLRPVFVAPVAVPYGIRRAAGGGNGFFALLVRLFVQNRVQLAAAFADEVSAARSFIIAGRVNIFNLLQECAVFVGEYAVCNIHVGDFDALAVEREVVRDLVGSAHKGVQLARGGILVH